MLKQRSISINDIVKILTNPKSRYRLRGCLYLFKVNAEMKPKDPTANTTSKAGLKDKIQSSFKFKNSINSIIQFNKTCLLCGFMKVQKNKI